jgi:PhnB protein
MMSHHYKPEGYNSVSPYLVVNGADATISFLESVFGATLLYRLADGERVMHAEVQLDDSVLMLADGSADFPTQPAHIHVYVPDVDTCHARALAAGAMCLQAPLQKADGDKRGGVQDVGGTRWWISTRME